MTLEQIIVGYGAIVAAYTSILYLNARNSKDNPYGQPKHPEPVNITIPSWIAVYTVIILAAIIPISMIISGFFDDKVFSHTQVYTDRIGNPLNPAEKMTIQIKMRSATFSANNPMPAEVIIALEGNYRDWQDWKTNTTGSFNVLFLSTYCGGIEVGHLPELCIIEVPQINEGQFYYNTTTLTYSRGGQFDVKLNAVGNSQEQTVGHGFIEITSTEGLNAFLTFKVTFIIAIIAAAFAALSVYEQHRNTQNSIGSSSASVKK